MVFPCLHSADTSYCLILGVAAKWTLQEHIQTPPNPKASSQERALPGLIGSRGPVRGERHSPWLAWTSRLSWNDLEHPPWHSSWGPQLPACWWAPRGGRRQGDPLRGQRKITGIKSSDLKWNVALGGKEKEKLKTHLAHEKELGRSLYVEWEIRSWECSRLPISGNSGLSVLLPEMGVWVVTWHVPHTKVGGDKDWKDEKERRLTHMSFLPQESVSCSDWRTDSDVMPSAFHHLWAENLKSTFIPHPRMNIIIIPSS